MILTYSMMACQAHHLATNYHGQGHTFDSTLAKGKLLQNMVMLQIKLKGMKRTTTYKQIRCSYIDPRSLRWGQKVKTFFVFTENGHVAYQIKGNFTSNNMKKNNNSLSLNIPSKARVRSNCHNRLFLKMGMLHIKLKGMVRTTIYMQTFCPYSQTRLLGWNQKGKNIFFVRIWSCCI